MHLIIVLMVKSEGIIIVFIAITKVPTILPQLTLPSKVAKMTPYQLPQTLNGQTVTNSILTVLHNTLQLA